MDDGMLVPLDADEAEAVRSRAAEAGLSVEAYARQQLIGSGIPVERFARDVVAWITEVAGEFADADAVVDHPRAA
jgi:plasmid stability protein